MTLNLVTDYPLGLIKRVPFKRHKLIEPTSPPIFIGIPWYFFSDAGLMPWATSTIGVLALLNALLTQPRPA